MNPTLDDQEFSVAAANAPLAQPAARTPHRFAVGQAVSYAEDGKSRVWQGGYQITGLSPLGSAEPRYEIRNADQSYDRIVWEHELCEDLGARERGQ